MFRLVLSVAFAIAIYALPAHAQYPSNVKAAVDVIVLFCVAGGEKYEISGGAKAEGGVLLRRLGVAGGGEIKVSKSEARGLVEGLRNEMTKLTAEQASEARRCMQPQLDRIVGILLAGSPSSPPAQDTKSAKAPTQSLQRGASSSGVYQISIPSDVEDMWVFYQQPGVANDKGCSRPLNANPISPSEVTRRISEFVEHAKANAVQLIFVAKSKTRGYVGAAEDIRVNGKPLRRETPHWCDVEKRLGYWLEL